MFAKLLRKAQGVAALALVLLLALLLAPLPPALAAGPAVLAVNTAIAAPGGATTLTVSVSENPGFAALNLTVNYDKSALTLTRVAPTGLLADSGGMTVSDTSVNDNFSYVRVQNITGNGALVELSFFVAKGAPTGNYPVSVVLKDGHGANFVNEAGSRLPVTFSAGAVTVKQQTTPPAENPPVDNPPAENPPANDPPAGNSGTLVSGPSSSGSTNTGTVAVGSARAGTSDTSSALQPATESTDELAATSEDTATTPLSDPKTPLDATTGTLNDTAAEQAGTPPWLAGVVIGVLALALAAAVWLVLRHRRRQTKATAPFAGLEKSDD